MDENEGWEELRRSYLEELEAAFPRWWGYWVAVKADPEDRGTLERLHREIHRLKGSAGSYGFPDLSQRAAALEERLEAILRAGVGPTKEVWEKVSALLSKLELAFLAAVREQRLGVPSASDSNPQGAGGKDPAPIRVLCVDDDPAWLQLLRYHLKEAGFEVRTLADPTRTFRLLDEFRPRFLVLDLDMPELDGLEICRRVRANRAFDDVVVFIVTAREDVEIPEECLRLGANEFCSKLLGPVGLAARLRLYTVPLGRYLAPLLRNN